MHVIVDAIYKDGNLTIFTNAKDENELFNSNSPVFTERARFYGVWSLYSLINKVIYYNVEVKEN